MRTIKPIPSISVTIEGEKVDILRQELLTDEVLGDALTSFEYLLNEITEAEYNIRKLYHARRSMDEELKALALKYVTNKKEAAAEEKKDTA